MIHILCIIHHFFFLSHLISKQTPLHEQIPLPSQTFHEQMEHDEDDDDAMAATLVKLLKRCKKTNAIVEL